MTFLGIHDGHNASVALVAEGEVVFALQEERVVGEKNFTGFPQEALRVVLEEYGLKPGKVDHVALSSRFMTQGLDRESAITAFQHQGGLRRVLLNKAAHMGLAQRWRERRSLAARMAWLEDQGLPVARVTPVDHHDCHAAAAYHGLCGDDRPRLVLTLDGGGDWLCASVNVAREGVLERVAETPAGHSVGDLYSRTTCMLGFTPWEHEYKLMGMAPYVDERYGEELAEIFDGYLGLNPRQPLEFRRKIFESTSHILPRLTRDLRGRRFDSICAGVQLFSERLVVEWARRAIAHTGIDELLLSGGVFMNVKLNQRLMELPEVKSVAAFPSCGDESNAIGAAMWLHHAVTGERCRPLQDYYLGPDFDEVAVRAAMDEAGVEDWAEARRVKDIHSVIADALAGGAIVARVSGRMEFGARALGNRSILADPANPLVTHEINQRIKNRDFWMPFAPVMMRARAGDYLANPKELPSPYMMLAFGANGRHEEFIAAIHPADRTARAQLLEPGQNLGLEAILGHFGTATGRHVLLNTSYNLHGSPIASGPREALDTFRRSGLRCLALDSWWLRKKDGTQP